MDITHAAWSRTPVFCIANARQYMKIPFVSRHGRNRKVRWAHRRVIKYVSEGMIRRGWATMPPARARGVPGMRERVRRGFGGPRGGRADFGGGTEQSTKRSYDITRLGSSKGFSE